MTTTTAILPATEAHDLPNKLARLGIRASVRMAPIGSRTPSGEDRVLVTAVVR